ncbi:DUF1652 domain-containing protein [Pseudomonas sp. B21-040]|jgi:hypothetical protein|uniref:DUF1652 domain-containing protein n=1 Tax=Pseudomonas TaxID=286 RepID=UPI0005FB6783|nr:MULTISPECIES: DUF1652 domain-containing protein [Pseudomonas]KJZ34013.1 hypothetical protein VC33_24555 [Pseudomonas fluorescens]OOG14454.1 hypothetical protein BMS17_20890 [Pseudomonas sp. C9]PWK29157.1 uncharacterized protein DUF1652 [Pseudomonas sp. OV226]UVL38777.1 DUF1652 domain-containing protein [Pseudomonas sp. B21-040]
MNLSTLEIQSIIEQSFLPSVCTCSMAPDQSMTIRVCDCTTGKVDLVSHVAVWELDTAHAITALVTQMQQEISAHKGLLPPTFPG